jgi:two-component system cell cycle response regulator CpdR
MSRVVLLVDDDALVRAFAALMLEDLGCEVVTAAGGRHAIDTLEILITDVNMPDMDGFAVAQAATRMRKELKVIILSGRENVGGAFRLYESHSCWATSDEQWSSIQAFVE